MTSASELILFAEQSKESHMFLMACLIVLICLVMIAIAILDLDYLFTSRKYRLLTKLIGRNGCRVFVGAIGVVGIVTIFVRYFLNMQK